VLTLKKNISELEEIVKKTQEVIKERDVSLASITLASLIASLSELGILTQGTVNALAYYFTPRICSYMMLKGITKEGDIKESLMKTFKEYAFKEDDFNVKIDDNEVGIEIVSDNCKICPKGVGGAGILGSACPIPYFVSICLSLITKNQWGPETIRKGGKVTLVLKEEGRCKMRIKRLKNAE